ncbi:hypothetical protein PPL_06757 [Heterostelium album PN500]|uniref:Uncharacterized protein n=1 Tax=Heterostelium pallidum (strain ATCC 26659 / Pp 5 / PN500) TaxID=670386 RepID=D3BFM2_HETP5|nr:hypothetical protein PPL_06757 [Heterostelium album PN500]EFA79936.1 hypothetical protein PPL_06757 [Heterostelium album PN500]|eukprot:XP_020432056.1 hypothetical protein PPL_06757 [Heterostelium album PN500]
MPPDLLGRNTLETMVNLRTLSIHSNVKMDTDYLGDQELAYPLPIAFKNSKDCIISYRTEHENKLDKLYNLLMFIPIPMSILESIGTEQMVLH